MEWVARGNNPNHRYHINFEITNSFVYEVYVFNLANHEMAFLETESVDEANEFLRTNLIRVGFLFFNRRFEMIFTESKWAERLNYLASLEAGWYEGSWRSADT